MSGKTALNSSRNILRHLPLPQKQNDIAVTSTSKTAPCKKSSPGPGSIVSRQGPQKTLCRTISVCNSGRRNVVLFGGGLVTRANEVLPLPFRSCRRGVWSLKGLRELEKRPRCADHGRSARDSVSAGYSPSSPWSPSGSMVWSTAATPLAVCSAVPAVT